MRKPNARDRILDTAGRLFFERGYSGVGINEIIEKADTAKASFYQHFPSKEALCEAWLSYMHELSESGRTELLASSLPPTEKVARYFDELAAMMKNSEFRGCPFSNTSAVSGSSCAGLQDRIRSHKISIRKFFRDVSRQHIAAPGEADEIGDRLYLLYSGAATESQNLGDIWPVEVARQAAVSLFEP